MLFVWNALLNNSFIHIQSTTAFKTLYKNSIFKIEVCALQLIFLFHYY